MKFLLVLLTAFLISCSSTYVGKYTPELVVRSCKLTKIYCKAWNESMLIKYSVTPLEKNEYLLEGFAQWDNSQISAVFSNVKSIKLDFVFLNGGYGVHEEAIWVSGDEGEKLRFKEILKIDEPFDTSVMAWYFATVTE